MKQNNLIKNLSRKGLTLLEKNATWKANAECWGFMYEPKVPKKLKKIICMMLVCAFTVLGVLSGASGVYKAENYRYAEWDMIVRTPIDSGYYTYVKLYVSPEETYRWGVTDFSTPSGYGQVELLPDNVEVIMVNNANMFLSQVGYKDFIIIEDNTTSTNSYATFILRMYFDSYPTSFSGYIKIY